MARIPWALNDGCSADFRAQSKGALAHGRMVVLLRGVQSAAPQATVPVDCNSTDKCILGAELRDGMLIGRCCDEQDDLKSENCAN